MKQIKQKIVVGMSGGMDSSMAAFLLKKKGWEPIGVSLKIPLWQGKRSFKNAKKICQLLKIPHYILDVRKEFEKKVVDYFIKEYKAARTPNPCMVCNPEMKFKKLLEFAKKKKLNFVATGHYAQRKVASSTCPQMLQRCRREYQVLSYLLLKAKDKIKDQSYYLSFLTQNQLKHIVFPMGNYTKTQVKNMAKKERMDFLIKQKESQDFCYCPSKLVSQFLKEKIGVKPGEIVNQQGKILGKHQGLHFYTIGQRKRIRLSGGPYFVLKLEAKTNRIIVTKNEKDLYQKEVILAPFNFISGQAPKKPIKVTAKIRYGHQEQSAILHPHKNKKLKLIFDKSQRAITPGQSAVFYDKNICLGGGKILSS